MWVSVCVGVASRPSPLRYSDHLMVTQADRKHAAWALLGAEEDRKRSSRLHSPVRLRRFHTHTPVATTTATASTNSNTIRAVLSVERTERSSVRAGEPEPPGYLGVPTRPTGPAHWPLPDLTGTCGGRRGGVDLLALGVGRGRAVPHRHLVPAAPAPTEPTFSPSAALAKVTWAPRRRAHLEHFLHSSHAWSGSQKRPGPQRHSVLRVCVHGVTTS